MFGKKQEKISQSQTPVPADVTFHVMPGSYRGVKAVAEKKTEAAIEKPAPATKRLVSKKMIIAGGVFVLLLAAGFGILLFLPAPEQTRVAETPPPSEVLPPESQSSEAPPSAESPTTEEAAGDTPSAEEAVPSAEEGTAEVVATKDSDQDGLTDTEESLYGTDVNKSDTDEDGYLDGQEVENLYNPSGTAPIRIADSSLVKTYANTQFSYRILYPATWTQSALDAGNPREILFTSPTDEFIQVIVDDNPEGLSAIDWYAKQFPDIKSESLDRIFIENLEGVWTKDKATAYLTKTTADAGPVRSVASNGAGKRMLYGISYNYGERTEVNFKTTLQMMLKSFRTP